MTMTTMMMIIMRSKMGERKFDDGYVDAVVANEDDDSEFNSDNAVDGDGGGDGSSDNTDDDDDYFDDSAWCHVVSNILF